MDIQTIDEMMEQLHRLELKLVNYINAENAQFVETEEMKILQSYSDTSRTLIASLYNEVISPFKHDVRSLNSKVIAEYHQNPVALLESLKYSLNLKFGVSKERAIEGLLKNINKC